MRSNTGRRPCLSEIAPQNGAKMNWRIEKKELSTPPKRTAAKALSWPRLRAMASVVRPLVWVLTLASNTILRAFGDKTSFTETRLSPEELQELLEEAGYGVVPLVEGACGHEATILGVEEKNEPQEGGDEATIEFLRIALPYRREQRATCLLVGGLEAMGEFVEGFEDLA